jgi:hypothetical protein
MEWKWENWEEGGGCIDATKSKAGGEWFEIRGNFHIVVKSVIFYLFKFNLYFLIIITLILIFWILKYFRIYFKEKLQKIPQIIHERSSIQIF